jgi:hypothetical protein
MRPRRIPAVLAAIAGLSILAGIPGITTFTALPAGLTQAAPAATHGTVLRLNLLQAPADTTTPATPVTSRPTPSTPASIIATGRGPASAANRHHTPVTVTGSPNVAGVSWQSVYEKAYGFRVEFPYATGSAGWLEHPHSDYTSGTSTTGFLTNFTADLFVADSGHGYCVAVFTTGCNPTGVKNEYYFVEVIWNSKYSYDPRQALDRINMGVNCGPNRPTYHGDLACFFNKGIYGGPGMTIWHSQHVYYLETGNTGLVPNDPARVKRFLYGISFPRG